MLSNGWLALNELPAAGRSAVFGPDPKFAEAFDHADHYHVGRIPKREVQRMFVWSGLPMTLEDLDDVQDVYSNADISEEVLAEL